MTELNQNKTNSPKLITLKDFVAGTIAGWFQVLVGQPFDMVKVRLQAQNPAIPYYKGPMDCMRKIAKEEGLYTFYKGSLSPLVGIGGCFAILFSVNEAAKRYLVAKHYNEDKDFNGNLTYLEMACCGAVAGVANATLSVPVEHIRIKVQVDGTKLIKEYTGSYQALKHVYNVHGLKGVYSGWIPTVPREGISYFFYFGLYEALMQLAEPYYGSRADIPLWNVMLFSSILGFGEWIPCFPFDVIKSRIQADDLLNPKYRTTMEYTKDIYRTMGVKGFFKGLAPCLIRSPPVNIATFISYELTVRFWDKYTMV